MGDFNKSIWTAIGLSFVVFLFLGGIFLLGCKPLPKSKESTTTDSGVTRASVQDSLAKAREELDRMRPKIISRQPSQQEKADQAIFWFVDFPNGERYRQSKYASNNDIYAGARRPFHTITDEIAGLLSGVKKESRNDQVVQELLKVVKPWALPKSEQDFTYEIHYQPEIDSVVYTMEPRGGIVNYVAYTYYDRAYPHIAEVPPYNSSNDSIFGYLDGSVGPDLMHIFLNDVRPWFVNAVKVFYLDEQKMPADMEELLAHFQLRPNDDFPEMWDNLTYFTDGNYFASLTFNYKGRSHTVEVDLSRGIELPWWGMTY